MKGLTVRRGQVDSRLTIDASDFDFSRYTWHLCAFHHETIAQDLVQSLKRRLEQMHKHRMDGVHTDDYGINGMMEKQIYFQQTGVARYEKLGMGMIRYDK